MTCPNSVHVYSRQIALGHPLGPVVCTPGKVDSKRGYEGLGVSLGPFGHIILGVWVLGGLSPWSHTSLAPREKQWRGPERGSSLSRNPSWQIWGWHKMPFSKWIYLISFPLIMWCLEGAKAEREVWDATSGEGFSPPTFGRALFRLLTLEPGPTPCLLDLASLFSFMIFLSFKRPQRPAQIASIF